MHVRRESMVTGLYANPNYDSSKKDLRGEMLRRIDEHYEEALTTLYGAVREEERDENNPFLAAINMPEVDEKLSEEELEALRTKPYGGDNDVDQT